jgi:hypothetical protein
VVRLKTLYLSSILTAISPKFAGPIRKGSATYLACAGPQTSRNYRSVKTRVSLALRLDLARVIGRTRTNSWDIPMMNPSLFYRNITDSTASHRLSYRKFYIPHHWHSLRWKRSGPHYAVRGRRLHVYPYSYRSLVHDRNCQKPPCHLRTSHTMSTPTIKNHGTSLSAWR